MKDITIERFRMLMMLAYVKYLLPVRMLKIMISMTSAMISPIFSVFITF